MGWCNGGRLIECCYRESFFRFEECLTIKCRGKDEDYMSYNDKGITARVTIYTYLSTHPPAFAKEHQSILVALAHTLWLARTRPGPGTPETQTLRMAVASKSCHFARPRVLILSPNCGEALRYDAIVRTSALVSVSDFEACLRTPI